MAFIQKTEFICLIMPQPSHSKYPIKSWNKKILFLMLLPAMVVFFCIMAYFNSYKHVYMTVMWQQVTIFHSKFIPVMAFIINWIASSNHITFLLSDFLTGRAGIQFSFRQRAQPSLLIHTLARNYDVCPRSSYIAIEMLTAKE